MIITKLDKPFPFRPAIDRSKGVHVSEIIKSIMQDLYGKDRDITEADRIRMDHGFLFERALEMAWQDLLGKRPGEIVVDGIAGSPDGVLQVEGHTIVEEYKCTWQSCKKPIDENMRWLMQMKCYCYMLETTYCNLHVLNINGDYKHPFAPQYAVYSIEYSMQELVENWNAMRNHAKAKGLLP